MRKISNDNAPDGAVRERRKVGCAPLLRMLLALSLASSIGCTAGLRITPAIAGYAVTPVDVVPLAIDGYPRFYYRDRYAYLVGSRWYYPTNDGWVMFLDEPPPLAQYRQRVQTAPPATRPPDVYYGYPPPRPAPEPPREIRREYRPY